MVFWALNDGKRPNLFYQEPDSGLRELLFRASVQNGRYVETDTYRRQLSSLLAQRTDPARLNAKPRTLAYTDEALEDFLYHLNDTTALGTKSKTDGGV